MITSQLTDLIANNFFSIVISAIVIYVIRFYTNYFNRPSKIPGPVPLPIIGNIHQIGGDFPAAAKNFRKRYGDLYEFYMGNRRIVTISRPDLVEKVWGPSSIKNTKFIMRNSYSEGIDELGLGTRGIVLNRNIEVWSINRKFMIQCISSPPFLREAVKLSSKSIDEVLGYWKTMGEKGSEIYVPDCIDALVADVVAMTAVGKKMSAIAKLFDKLNVNEKNSKLQGLWENGTNFVKAIHTYNESMAFMMLLPTSFRRNFPGIKNVNKKYLDNKSWIEDELERIVIERRTEIENTPSNKSLDPTILTLLLTTNTEKDLEKLNVGKFDRPLTDEELVSIIREVFTGGLDTTSNTLSFIIFYIAKYPEVYSRIREEVLSVYGTLDNPELTFESYGKLKYTEAVINESIRIFPTISIIPRTATEDVDFNGFKIEADTTVYTDMEALSNDPQYFKDPEKFNPDRFLDEKDPIKRFTYIPFGNGVRICPGRAWAIVQIKTFLIKLVCTLDIELVDKNASPKYVYATANRPVDINIRVKSRKV